MTAFKNGQNIAYSSDKGIVATLRRDQGRDRWYLVVQSHDGRKKESESWRTIARLGLTPDAARALVA